VNDLPAELKAWEEGGLVIPPPEALASLVWPQVVAITGSIGSGKSALLSMLERRGWKVLSADGLVRELREPGRPAYRELVEAFGKEILDPQNRIDSAALAHRVFSNPGERKRLEEIVLPWLEREALTRFAQWVAAGETLLAYEAPTLFEAGAHKRGWKQIVLVTAPTHLKVQRVRQRDGSSQEKVEARLAAQMSDEEKALLSDLIIPNPGSLADLEEAAKLDLGLT
jgi:dephospho-CoA kinase